MIKQCMSKLNFKAEAGLTRQIGTANSKRISRRQERSKRSRHDNLKKSASPDP